MAPDNCCRLGSPKTTLDIIHSLLYDYNFAIEEVAQMANMPVERLQNIINLIDIPSLPEKDKFIHLRDIIRVQLHGSLTHKGVNQWFHAQLNYMHGATPLEALAEDKISLVHEAASAFAEGSYL